jgi:hypothetical protein
MKFYVCQQECVTLVDQNRLIRICVLDRIEFFHCFQQINPIVRFYIAISNSEVQAQLECLQCRQIELHLDFRQFCESRWFRRVEISRFERLFFSRFDIVETQHQDPCEKDKRCESHVYDDHQ